MYNDKESWLSEIKTTAKQFIDRYYAKESPLFETFWQVFALNFKDADPFVQNSAIPSATDISFVQENALDLVTPIVLGTLAEMMVNATPQQLSPHEVEQIIGTAATRYGAKPSLIACLIKNLPVLYKDLLSCDKNISEAVVSTTSPRHYRIWTGGKILVAETLDKYEKHKHKYLFWIDLDSHKNKSSRAPGQQLKPMSIRLLKCLVENLGSPVSLLKIRQTIGDPNATAISPYEIEVISQSLSGLNTFCGSKLSGYYSRTWKRKGLGLDLSFQDKYFLYEKF